MAGFAGILHLDMSPVTQMELSRLRMAASRDAQDGEELQQLGTPHEGCIAVSCAPGASEMNLAVPRGARDGEVWAVCDGRLDNEAELCAQCRNLYSEESPSTAQLVLAAYANWGVNCPAYLLGDYAFVLWDAGRRRFLCARDPAQTKSVFTVFNGKSLRWCNDLRPLLQEPDVSQAYDEIYLTTYMVMASVNWERTPYKAIRQLPGGHLLVVEKGALTTRQWWQPPAPGSLRFKSNAECREQLRTLLHDAVRVRLRSQSPVTITLSRGADSASITASAALLMRQGQAPCPAIQGVTFAARQHPEADESSGAAAIARHLGIEHHIVEPAEDEDDFAANLSLLAEPSGMVVHWNEWRAVRRACEENGCRVLLTGIGGEVFENQFLYLGDLAREKRWLMLAREFWRWKQAGNSFAAPAKATLRALREPPSHWEPHEKLVFYPWLRDAGRCKTDWHSLSLRHPLVQSEYHNFVERGSVMRGLGPLFAPAGIEVRNPLTDRRLIEFACALPLEYKLPRPGADGRLMKKALLREAVEPELPLALTAPSKPLRAKMGPRFERHHRRISELLAAPPCGLKEVLEDVIDLRVLREHLYQMQQDTGGKRYVALTLLLCSWLSQSAAQQIDGTNLTQKEVIS